MFLLLSDSGHYTANASARVKHDRATVGHRGKVQYIDLAGFQLRIDFHHADQQSGGDATLAKMTPLMNRLRGSRISTVNILHDVTAASSTLKQRRLTAVPAQIKCP